VPLPVCPKQTNKQKTKTTSTTKNSRKIYKKNNWGPNFTEKEKIISVQLILKRLFCYFV